MKLYNKFQFSTRHMPGFFYGNSQRTSKKNETGFNVDRVGSLCPNLDIPGGPYDIQTAIDACKQFSFARVDPADLKMLAEPHIAEIAIELCGQPNQKLSSSNDLRFGTKGSLSTVLHTSNAGRWKDHETGDYGSIIDLVMRELAIEFSSACKWLTSRLGLTDQQPDTSFLLKRRAEVDAYRSAQKIKRFGETRFAYRMGKENLECCCATRKHVGQNLSN